MRYLLELGSSPAAVHLAEELRSALVAMREGWPGTEAERRMTAKIKALLLNPFLPSNCSTRWGNSTPFCVGGTPSRSPG